MPKHQQIQQSELGLINCEFTGDSSIRKESYLLDVCVTIYAFRPTIDTTIHVVNVLQRRRSSCDSIQARERLKKVSKRVISLLNYN